MLADPQAWVAFITLTALEIVLGIDNIIFISILVSRLPPERRETARITGLALAMLTRIALLFSIVWLTRLTKPWFSVFTQEFSGRDIILLLGGLFLLAKSVTEIHGTLEGVEDHRKARVFASFTAIVIQIAIIDIVFSLDSVFTAVGLARPDQLPIMVAAIVIAIGVMMWVSGSISTFIERHPTIKILALAFLILVGVVLVAESFHFDVPKGYLYFAMAFSVGVEMVNIRLRRLIDERRNKKGRERRRLRVTTAAFAHCMNGAASAPFSEVARERLGIPYNPATTKMRGARWVGVPSPLLRSKVSSIVASSSAHSARFTWCCSASVASSARAYSSAPARPPRCMQARPSCSRSSSRAWSASSRDCVTPSSHRCCRYPAPPIPTHTPPSANLARGSWVRCCCSNMDWPRPWSRSGGLATQSVCCTT